MTKIILCVFMLFCLHTSGQTSFYDLNVQTAYGGEFNMKQFRGQKVLIAAINVDNFKKKGTLQFWDSLQTAHPKIAFILIPASDHDSTMSGTNTPAADTITTSGDSIILQQTKTDISPRMTLAKMAKVKKRQGERQHPLMRWLTNVDQNSHFNLEVESDVQIYVVSESGELYAVLTKDTPRAALRDILRQPDVRPSSFR